MNASREGCFEAVQIVQRCEQETMESVGGLGSGALGLEFSSGVGLEGLSCVIDTGAATSHRRCKRGIIVGSEGRRGR